MTSLEYNHTTNERIPKVDSLVMSAMTTSYLAMLLVARSRKMSPESRNLLLGEKITQVAEVTLQELLFAPLTYPM